MDSFDDCPKDNDHVEYGPETHQMVYAYNDIGERVQVATKTRGDVQYNGTLIYPTRNCGHKRNYTYVQDQRHYVLATLISLKERNKSVGSQSCVSVCASVRLCNF
jgi:hypothetical protein